MGVSKGVLTMSDGLPLPEKLVRANFRTGHRNKVGWTAIWLVDDAGYVLHTEPVCTVPAKYHQWFIDWLVQQQCPEMFHSVRHDEEAT